MNIPMINDYQNHSAMNHPAMINHHPITSMMNIHHDHHLTTIRENEALRISISSSSSIPSEDALMMGNSSTPHTSLQQMPDCRRPENISKPFGPGNLDTVQAYQNIVSILVEDAQKYEEALDVCEEILEILHQVFGNKDDLTIATTYSNMGGILERLSRYSEATECYQEALRIRLKVLGHKDAETVVIHKMLHNLKFKKNMTAESSLQQ